MVPNKSNHRRFKIVATSFIGGLFSLCKTVKNVLFNPIRTLVAKLADIDRAEVLIQPNMSRSPTHVCSAVFSVNAEQKKKEIN
jgi:hypothetical protein